MQDKLKISREEASEIRNKARHEELVVQFNRLLEKLGEEKEDNSEIVKVLTEQFKELKKSVDNFKVEVKETTVENKITVEQDKVIEKLENIFIILQNKFSDIQLNIQKRPEKWTFKVQRDEVGYMTEITAIAQN
jgi:uncharacterized coiled-coil protein SlyX